MENQHEHSFRLVVQKEIDFLFISIVFFLVWKLVIVGRPLEGRARGDFVR